MANAFGVWQPSAPGDNSPQVWTNTQTGQQVYGSFNGLSGIKLIDRTTGQPTGYHALVNGQQHKDDSMLHQFLVSLPKVGAVVAGGAGLAGLTAGSAGAAGAAGADAALPSVDMMSAAGTPAMAGTSVGASAIPSVAGASSLAPTLARLGTAGLGVGLNLASRNPAQAQNAPLMAALNTLLPQLQQRFTQTQPLFGNVVNMAHGMLPKAYQ